MEVRIFLSYIEFTLSLSISHVNLEGRETHLRMSMSETRCQFSSLPKASEKIYYY